MTKKGKQKSRFAGTMANKARRVFFSEDDRGEKRSDDVVIRCVSFGQIRQRYAFQAVPDRVGKLLPKR